MKSNQTLYLSKTKSFLLFCLMCFCFCVQSALAVDWGTSTAYRSQITQGGVQGNFYYLDRADGGVTITGIQLDSQPTAGDVVYIPETLDGKPVYGIYRCGQTIRDFNLPGNTAIKYHQYGLLWENAPTSLVLSLPGSMKDVAREGIGATTHGTLADEIANEALTELIIRESTATPDMYIGIRSFEALPNLTKVTLGKGVKCIGHSAFNASPITTISAFPDGLEVVESYAFASILVEQDLYLPSTLTILGDFAFGDALQGKGWFFHNQLTIPAGMKFLGHYVFCGSRMVGMNVDLPEGLETIRTTVFVNTFIKEITIPSTVVEINNSAFSRMVMLEKVKFKANSVLAKLGNSVFRECPNLRYIDMSEVESSVLTMSGLSRSAGTFNGVYPYTIIYLPKSATADGVVADAQENFVQYQNGAWTCKNFVAYDSHSAYLPANINYATVFAATNVHYAPNKMTAEEQKAFTDWKASLIAGRGCDYDMPMGFTATSAVYKRAFATAPAADALMTVSLPYNTTTAQAGLKLFKLVSEKELNGSYNNKGEYFLSLDDSRLNQSSLTTEEQAQCATANHAYVVKVADATGLGSADANNYYSLFASTNATVLATPATYTAVTADDGKSTWSFAGHPMNISNADAVTAKFYVLNGSTKTWQPIKTTNTSGFLHSFRGALQYTGASTSYAQAFPKLVGADEALDTTTGINAVETSATSDTAVYSLDGRKVGTSLATLPAGVYVVGGQKVVK